jgi:hypothetical protein
MVKTVPPDPDVIVLRMPGLPPEDEHADAGPRVEVEPARLGLLLRTGREGAVRRSNSVDPPEGACTLSVRLVALVTGTDGVTS